MRSIGPLRTQLFVDFLQLSSLLSLRSVPGPCKIKIKLLQQLGGINKITNHFIEEALVGYLSSSDKAFDTKLFVDIICTFVSKASSLNIIYLQKIHCTFSNLLIFKSKQGASMTELYSKICKSDKSFEQSPERVWIPR